MGVVSGIGGLVDGESCVREWKIRTQRIAPPGAHNLSKAGTVRSCGVTDWRGFYTGFGHTPTQFPGDTFEFKGEAGPDASNLGATCPASGAIVDRITITWDVETGKKIEYRVDFSSNGALTLGSAAASDAGSPVLVCSQGMSVRIGGAAQTDIRYMQLVMSAANRPYVSSDTAGLVLRTRGNFDARFTYRLYQDTPASLPALNTPAVYKFNVTDSTYWELQWMQVERIDPYGPNLETAENLGGTVHGVFNAFIGTQAGHVNNPATAEKWPYS